MLDTPTLITLTVATILIVTFWPNSGHRRRRRDDDTVSPTVESMGVQKAFLDRFEQATNRAEQILAETVLDDVKCQQLGNTLYVTGSYLHNGYVRRNINVQVRGLPHDPLNRTRTQHIFNRQQIINEINKAIKEAPQWNY